MDPAGPAQVRAGFRVTGRVQGVGFRWWGRRHAQQLGLRGTIRNCPDGSVELQLAGAAGAIERLRSLLAEGPPGARVQRVDELGPTADPLPESFQILA